MKSLSPDLKKLLVLTTSIEQQLGGLVEALAKTHTPDIRSDALMSDLEQALAALRQAHQAQLVRLDQVAGRAQGLDVVRAGLRAALREARVRRVDTVEDEAWFDASQPGFENSASVVVSPAYVDAQSRRLIQPGRLGTDPAGTGATDDRDKD